MIATNTQKFVVILAVLLLLGLVGYFIFNNADIPATPADLSSEPVVGQDILILADKVNTISIDQSVFSSTVFLSLIDHEIPLAAEPQGRPNPFASLGGGSTGAPLTGKTTVQPPR